MRGKIEPAGGSTSLPVRRAPSHCAVLQPGNRSTIVFLTVCTRNRSHVLADPRVAQHLLNAWSLADAWSVGRYVIMPDHVHLFVSPRTYPPLPLQRWVSYWKSLTARRWPYPRDQSIWQADFWDTQLRAGESYGAKWEYVRQNPVRAGLVAHPDQWPYHGELNVLMWHDA